MDDFVDCYQDIDASDAFKDYLKKMVFKTLDFYYDYYQCERGMAGSFCPVKICSQLQIAVWLAEESHMKFRKFDGFRKFRYFLESWYKMSGI